MSIVAENNITFAAGLTATSLPVEQTILDASHETLATSVLPTTRVEAWKYTRVAKIGKIDFTNQVQQVTDLSKYKIDPTAPILVFVNGHLDTENSSSTFPEGMSVKSLADCTVEELPKSNLKVEDEVFSSVNSAFLSGGVFISVSAKAVIEQPVQVIHILKGAKTISNFRTIIQADSFSKASVIQGFFAEDAEQSFANNITEVHVAENAFLTLEKVQFESEETFHISTEKVNQAKNSTFTINTITLNGGLVRNNLNIDVNGENCTTYLNSAYLLKGKQHVDNHTVVDHLAAHCDSHELYKGVMDEQSTAVFNGKVFVRKDSQKINAFQSNGNVLLSDLATINSKPELEIYADDVKCSHGSTTGQLDEQAVFYLRARGLSEKSARQLMTSAFIGEVLEKIENDSVLAFSKKLLAERFDWSVGE